jgi:type VI secretion system secreted protein VgrG
VWIRVVQPSAGKGWGAVFLPRIGHEVLVEFLEGDPDLPIIVGSVYNGENMPPYDLPTNKTISTVKTNSSLGGAGYNEIRFEDKKGEEEIFVHAEKDERIYVGNDVYEWIGNDRHLTVKKKQYKKVEEDVHTHVMGNVKEKIDSNVSTQVGMNRDEKVGMKHAMEAGQEVHLKAGMKAIFEAGLQLTIKAAGGFVDIGPAGVTISGTIVNINSGGAAGTGSGASPEAPTDPVTVGAGMPGDVGAPAQAPKPPVTKTYGGGAGAMQQASASGAPLADTGG